MEQLRIDYKNAEREWDASNFAKPFRSALKDFKDQNQHRRHIAICLALGRLSHSPSETRESEEERNRSLLQLAAFDDAASILVPGKRRIVQDPDFPDLDKTFLNEDMGYEVVEDPSAFGEIAEEAFVFMPFMPRDVISASQKKLFSCWVPVANDLKEVYESPKKDVKNLKERYGAVWDEGLKKNAELVIEEYQKGYDAFLKKWENWRTSIPEHELIYPGLHILPSAMEGLMIYQF
ncbi:hypothetical protein EV356DRAFT_536803 [Viridothelium virens]|uniref:SRR1-like domain-containing protein n=1 Tax=Viridothelium virens TaxID=1048519 RepID=A0A6A6GW70_VIRVR|nr:hypothetical protein EV356DRAFT_536803 [Viridothelium virens]